MKLTDEEVRLLVNWANAETTGYGPAFDGALTVAQAVAGRVGSDSHKRFANPYRELCYLVGQVNQIYRERYDERSFTDHEAWEAKYNLIFSDELSGRIQKLMPVASFDPPEYRVSYYEEVWAYVSALDETWKRNREALRMKYEE